MDGTRPPEPLEEPEPLEDLVRMSRAYGSDPALAVAGGGNTSVKLGERLLVKASGVALADVSAEDFVELERPALQALLQRELGQDREEREVAFKDALLAARADPRRGQRPSVESLLHHLLPGRFVVHLHATLVNQFSCAREGRRLVEQHLGNQVCWVELVDPGFALAKLVQERLRAFAARTGRQPRALIMKNHGLVLSARSTEQVHDDLGWLLAMLEEVRDAVGPSASPQPASSSAGAASTAADGKASVGMLAGDVSAVLADWSRAGKHGHETVTFDASEPVARLVRSEDARGLVMGGPLTPDQIVYCGSVPLWVDIRPGETTRALLARLTGTLDDYISQHGVPPKVVLVEGLGLFAIGRGPKQAEAARLVYVDAVKVMQGALGLGGVSYLDDNFCHFIEHWEVEAYRRQLGA